MRILRDMWEELRPRFVYLRLHTKGLRFRWMVPLPVLEELLGLAVKLAPTVLWAIRQREAKQSSGLLAELPALTLSLLSDDGRGVLRLPSGEVFALVETPEVTIEIGQL